MKYIISFLLLVISFLLLIFTLGYGLSQEYCLRWQVPRWVLCYLDNHFHIQCDVITVYPYRFDIKNFKTSFKSAYFQCQHLSIQFRKKWPWAPISFDIHQGQLQMNNNAPMFIQGHIERLYRSYRGVVCIHNIRLWVQDFVPSEILQSIFNFNKANLSISALNFENFQLYSARKRQGLYTQYQFKNLHIYDLYIDTLIGDSVIKDHQISTHLHSPFVISKKIKAEAWLSFKNDLNDIKEGILEDVSFITKGDVLLLKQSEIFTHSLKFSFKQNSEVFVSISGSDIQLYGQGYINLRTNRWYVTKGLGQVQPQWIWQVFPQWISAYPLSLTYPIYVWGRGHLKHFQCKLQTNQLALNKKEFSKARTQWEYNDKLKKLNWEAQLQSKVGPLWVKGYHNLKAVQGRLLCQGWIDPKITYPLRHWLPDWWYPFFSQFSFYKKPPWSDFDLRWGQGQNYLFGQADIKHCQYKHTNLKQLKVIFGHQPGYCWLKIDSLQTPSGQGCCTIHWPYSQDKTQERWIFKGKGQFNVLHWETILSDFLGHSKKFKPFQYFDPASQAHLKFHGEISNITQSTDFFYLKAYFNHTRCYEFPFKNFRFSYHWYPQKINLDAQEGLLFRQAPINIHWEQQKNLFSLTFEGKNIPTGQVLQCPLFTSWVTSIPPNNRKSYEGELELSLQCKGDIKPSLQVSGTGHLDFQNQHLSEIHILSPLSSLLSKGIKLRPTVQLNRLVSDFSFTEEKITSQQTQLLGPSTRADIEGAIGIKDKRLDANIHFSFLDFNQLKIPVMRHLVQLFTPISKGFSASVHGTFDDPQWTTTFNPLRFVFPNSPRSRPNRRKQQVKP